MPSAVHMMMVYHSMPAEEAELHARADDARYTWQVARRELDSLGGTDSEARAEAAARLAKQLP